MLSHDAWIQIGLHLKPRHLAKLMLTSKAIKAIVDNYAYWTRVAAHLVWRESNAMQVNTPVVMYNFFFGFLDNLQSGYIDHNLYHMIGLERGYYWSMERFFLRIEEFIEFYSTADDYVELKKFATMVKPMSLSERTKAFLRTEDSVVKNGSASEDHLLSMKEIARKRTEKSLRSRPSEGSHQRDFFLNDFVREIEDHPMPAAYKRDIMSSVHMLLLNTTIMTPGACDITDIIAGACKF